MTDLETMGTVPPAVVVRKQLMQFNMVQKQLKLSQLDTVCVA